MISVRLYASTNIGLRGNNEDSFTVCPDLSLRKWEVPDAPSQGIPLGERGSLIVVADGMGGQNAGEVASDIAIKTVQEMFSPECLPEKATRSSDSAKAWMRKVIVEADKRVRDYGSKHSESEGLGSTIVMAWLLGNSVFVAWMGDSRAYSFVPYKGIARLSKDHSYVQQLVDANRLSEEEAMNHPNSNVITRSLGDTSQKAKPDVAEYVVEDGEIIILCSDGLCGVCRDEEIGYIVNEDKDDLRACADKLTAAALSNGGSDNITIAMLRIEKKQAKGERQLPRRLRLANKKQGIVFAIASALVLVLLLAIFLAGAIRHFGKPQTGTKAEDPVPFTFSGDTLEFGESITFTKPADCSLKYESSLLKVIGNTIRMKKEVATKTPTTVSIVSNRKIMGAHELVLMPGKGGHNANKEQSDTSERNRTQFEEAANKLNLKTPTDTSKTDNALKMINNPATPSNEAAPQGATGVKKTQP